MTEKVDIERTFDRISSRDIRAAYRELGLDPNMDYEDDLIIGTFESRLRDARKQENKLRLALNVIGLHRSSQKIQNHASSQGNIGFIRRRCSAHRNTEITYEQALSCLGAESTTADGFICSLYTAQVTLLCSFVIYHPHHINVKLHFCQDTNKITFN